MDKEELLNIPVKKVKLEKTIGVIWLVLGVGLMYQGFNDLFKCSTPHILWLFMLSVEQVYTEIIFGLLFSTIGISYINNRSERYFIVLLFAFVVFLHTIIDFFKNENYLNITMLFLMFLISIYILRKNYKSKNLSKYLKENRIRVTLLLLLGLSPYLLAIIAPYHFYYFLH